MKLQQALKPELIHNGPYEVSDGYFSEVQISRYDRRATSSRLVVFEEPTLLLDWCKNQGVDHAINGGFTMYHRQQRPTELLGHYRVGGRLLPSLSFTSPRSGVHIAPSGELSLVHKDLDPVPEQGDYFQAGPMLLKNGDVLVIDGYDFEGVADPPLQMDDDWTRKRFPRSAIGLNDDSIFAVTCNGYSPPEHSGDQGLSLMELSHLMAGIGVKDALNLDGGSKATLIANGRIVNSPRGGLADGYSHFHEGLPILSAIIFEP